MASLLESELVFWTVIYGGTAFALLIWFFVGMMALNRMRDHAVYRKIDWPALQSELDEEFAPKR